MNDYEAKQEQRRQRLMDKADRLIEHRDRLYEEEKDRGKYVPLGQPILVGHHSEKRHRAYLSGMDKLTRKQIAASEHAQELIRKAEAVGRGGISADDPDAITKLECQLADLEADQVAMKAVNKLVKKLATEEERMAVVAMHLTPDQREKLMWRNGVFYSFPAYALTNNGSNIRRIKARLEELRKSRSEDNVEIEGEGYTYQEDADDNRAIFTFNGNPDETTRNMLKRRGWRWAPSRGEWIRQLTSEARESGRWLCGLLDAQENGDE